MSRLNELLEKQRASMWVTIHDGKQVRLLSSEDAHELIQLLCDEREQSKFGPSPLVNYESGRAVAKEHLNKFASDIEQHTRAATAERCMEIFSKMFANAFHGEGACMSIAFEVCDAIRKEFNLNVT